jgi:aminobenzoyl-glutamate utilization protein B
MTGTEVKIVFDKACSNVIQNAILESTLRQAMGEIGVPAFSEEELAFAKDLQSSLSAADIAEEFGRYPKELEAALKEKPMAEVIIPYSPASNRSVGGSTDVGDVSWFTIILGTRCLKQNPSHPLGLNPAKAQIRLRQRRRR